MSEIGGQMHEFALHIASLPIPALQCLDGKAVPQIVKARRSAPSVQNACRET